MAYHTYAPEIKVAVVRMAQQGLSSAKIRHLLEVEVSLQSFRKWLQLFHKTQCVVKDPSLYERHGQPASLTPVESSFMIELVRLEPGLFLHEIQERLYDSSGLLLSTKAVHHNLVERLLITLKKAKTKNIQKLLTAKYSSIKKMEFFPAEFLVFTDKSSFCDSDLL